MPRPVVEQKVVTAPTPVAESQAPQLGVYAPMEGLRSPGSSGFAGLAQALGVITQAGGPILADRAQATQKADLASGTTDAELGQVDQERLQHSRAYAGAVHKVQVIKQYQDALASTKEWAVTNIDGTKPFGDQTAQFDAQMKQQLGGLAKDPAAAAVIAPLYTKDVNEYANSVVKAQVQAKQNEALDTLKGSVVQSLQSGGDGDYVGAVATLAPILGDRTKAVKAVTQMYIDHAHDVAAQGGDWNHVFNSLPTDITLADGTKIPGPGRSPALHDAIVRGKADAQSAYNDHMEPLRAQAQLHVMTQLDNRARHGGLITEQMMKPLIEPGADGQKPLLTAAQAAGYMDRARNKAEELAKEATVRAALNPNWMSLIGQQIPGQKPGTTYSKEIFQHGYDQTLGMATQNFSTPDTADQAIALTRQNPGLISTNLQTMLVQAANTTDPKAAVKMLPVFEALSDAKQIGMYLPDPKTRTYYQVLAEQVKAGAPDAQNATAVMNAATNYDPQRDAQLTSPANMKAVRDQVVKSVGGDWHWYTLGVTTGASNLTDFANAGQVQIDIAERSKDALRMTNGNTVQAAAIINKQLESDYVPVSVQGQKLLIPSKDGADQATVQANFKAISDDLIPDLAKRASLSPDQAKEQLGWQVYVGATGKPMVQVVDDMGQRIDAIAPYPLDWFLQKGNELRMKNEDQQRRDSASNTKAIEQMNAQRRASMFSAGRGS